MVVEVIKVIQHPREFIVNFAGGTLRSSCRAPLANALKKCIYEQPRIEQLHEPSGAHNSYI